MLNYTTNYKESQAGGLHEVATKLQLRGCLPGSFEHNLSMKRFFHLLAYRTSTPRNLCKGVGY